MTALILAAGPAGAAELCVNPEGSGGCHRTIQAAVRVAASEDVIRIAAGTYFESVTVTSPRVRLVGVDRATTIVDASRVTGGQVVLATAGSDIQNLTIRNTALRFSAAGTAVRGVTFIGAPSGQVWSALVDNVDAQIRNSTFDNAGIRVQGSAARALIQGNRITQARTGVEVVGGEARVFGNEIDYCNYGVWVHPEPRGADARVTVRSNFIRHLWGSGVRSEGGTTVVDANLISGTAYGVELRCISCAGTSVTGNHISRTHQPAIVVQADTPGVTVENNTLLEANEGIVLSGTGITVQRNRVTNSGQRTDNVRGCLHARGTSHVVEANDIRNCLRTGIFVDGDGITVRDNLVRLAFGNGILVARGSYNVISGNNSFEHFGQGIAVQGAAQITQVLRNHGTGSRTDYCNESGSTIAAENRFTTTGACDVRH